MNADDEDDEMEASEDGKKFANIKTGEYQQSMSFLMAHPHILTEQDQDGLMVLGFDAALQGDEDFARKCVHQSLLLQYCRTLGRDGVQLFFKRVTGNNNQARDMFFKDVQDTFMKLRTRAREINVQRAKDAAEGKDKTESKKNR